MQRGALQQANPITKLIFSVFIIISSFLVLVFAGFIFAMIFYQAGYAELMRMLSDISHPRHISVLRYFQIVQSTALFIIPSIALSFFFSVRPKNYLALNTNPRLRQIIITLLIVLSAVPVINGLAFLNEQIQFPGFLESLERWLKQTEERAKVLTELFLKVDNIQGLLLNLFMIAFIPAVGEELLFRGIIQRIFTEWTKNVHAGIWIAAILFSAMHLQFYGFLPRTVLGAIFGYMLVWSGSMWFPVLAHFFNNAAAVYAYYMIEKRMVNESIESFGTASDEWGFILVSLFFLTAFLLIFKIQAKNGNGNKYVSGIIKK